VRTVIGLTGGMGSGKSTVGRILAELGAVVVDADDVGHEVIRRGRPAYDQLVSAFGRGIIGPDGEIDRGRLAGTAFSAPAGVARLNAITHPRILDDIRQRLEAYRRRSEAVAAFVVEAPLLFESGLDRDCDETWTVTADPQAQARRLAERGVGTGQVQARLRAQLSAEERERRADVVIDNSGSLEQTRRRVLAEWRRLTGAGTDGNRPPAGRQAGKVRDLEE